MWLAIIIFIIGLVVGSFLNVVIYRMRELHTVIATRSHCPKCKREIAWYDLIPFLSFLILKTRCRVCGKPISWQYPLVEIGTACLFLALYWKFGLSVSLFFSSLVSTFLIVIFVYDLKTMLIPDEMLYPAIVITLIYLAFGSASNFKFSLYGVLIAVGFLGIIYLIGRGKWMGFGDVKLAVLLGLVSPFPEIFVTLFSAFLIGSIVGILMIIVGKKTFKSEIPFGPFLILGLYISIFWGEKILGWYLNMI